MENSFVNLSRVDLINLVYALNIAIMEHKKLIDDESQEVNLALSKLQLMELEKLREDFDRLAMNMTLQVGSKKSGDKND